MRRSSYCLTIILILLSSCGIRTIQSVPENTAGRRHVQAVFMDGTNNKSNKDPLRNTHVKTLHGLVVPAVPSYYVEGVGTRRKWFGGLVGVGTKARVTRAYRFIARNYQPGDSIFLFGFSRGANQCRIISNLIATVGILDMRKVRDSSDMRKIVNRVYRRHCRRDSSLAQRQARITKWLGKWNQRHTGQEVDYDLSGTVKVEMMGLYETVEAFDIMNRQEITHPKKNHLNQVLNSNKILHAVALDDNRAWTYTPVLLSTKEVMTGDSADIKKVVEEVWFNGSHRDVGGGHKKDAYLHNISLNWMLARTKKYSLFRNDSTIHEYRFAQAHDMNGTIWLRMAFANNLRSIPEYYQAMRDSYNGKRMKVHISVIERLAQGVLPFFKRRSGGIDWFDLDPFSACFKIEGEKRILQPGCTCIEVVGNEE